MLHVAVLLTVTSMVVFVVHISPDLLSLLYMVLEAGVGSWNRGEVQRVGYSYVRIVSYWIG